MTVALVNEHMVRFYGSKNLREWTKLSDFGPAGSTRNGWECPSLIPLPVNGDLHHIKYVLFVSLFGDHGPAMQYFVGDFDGKTFKNLNSADKVFRVDHGDSFYAAIAWRDAPQDKKILLGWLINGKPETYPWKGQMSIPRDLSLRTTGEGIRLFQNPTTIINNRLAKLSNGTPFIRNNMPLKGMVPLSNANRFNKNAYWIEADIQPGKSAKTGFVIAENKNYSKMIMVGYDRDKQELYVDCSKSEHGRKDTTNLVQTAPLKPSNGIIKLWVLVDRSSLEVFGNGGEQVISTMIYPDNDATALSAFSTPGSVIKTLKIWDMD